MFDYLTKHCGYSPGSAQRRIDAARLMNDVPEVAEKIEAGELTLSQVSHVQKAIRQLKKESRIVTKFEKQELVQKLIGLSESESQHRVAETFNLEIKQAAKINHQANKSIRLEITLTEKQWNLLKQAQEVLSHQVPDGDLSDLITKMGELVIKQRHEIKSSLKAKSVEAKPTSTATVIPAMCQSLLETSVTDSQQMPLINSTPDEINSKLEEIQIDRPENSNKTLTQKTKRIILDRDKCCAYIDPKTKQRCQSKWQLEIDHIQPRWAQGSHAMRNLQVLCRTHNQYRYKQQRGIRH